jgi:hypothetical protein
MFKIDYYIFKYFLTSKLAVLTKICLMVIHFYTAYFKRRITSSASEDSHTVLYSLWVIQNNKNGHLKATKFLQNKRYCKSAGRHNTTLEV